MRKRSPKTSGNVVSIFDHLDKFSPEGRDFLKSMLASRSSATWKGRDVVPPGSLLDDLVELFRLQTDIPLELPLMAGLSFVSGHLNAVGACIDLGFGCEPAKLWTVVLAGSGSGKTYAIQTVEKMLTGDGATGAVPMLAQAASAAKFVDNLAQTPRGLWVRDEFGQLLSQIGSQTHMEELKDILLQLYSGGPIVRSTRQGTVEIGSHALSILGVTVQETFEQQIGVESLVDGFAQRFNYLVAERDPDRPITDFPIYFENTDAPEIASRIRRVGEAWTDIVTRGDLHAARFTVHPDARDCFKRTFRELFGRTELPPSFYRRCLFSAFSYAVLFHVVCGKPGVVVGADSMAIAGRMVAIHLDHGRKLLADYGAGPLEKALRKAEVIRDRLFARGEELTPRDLISGIREIRDARMARDLMALMCDQTGAAAGSG